MCFLGLQLACRGGIFTASAPDPPVPPSSNPNSALERESEKKTNKVFAWLERGRWRRLHEHTLNTFLEHVRTADVVVEETLDSCMEMGRRR